MNSDSHTKLHFDSTSLENRASFAAYLNMARQNFIDTLNLIFAKARTKIELNDGNLRSELQKLGESGKKTLKDNEFMNIHSLLYRHFPVLKPIMASETAYQLRNTKQNRKDPFSVAKTTEVRQVFTVIYNIACCLTDRRNFYTHYCPYSTPEELKSEYAVQKSIIAYLNKVVDASRRLNKERKDLTPEELEFITGHGSNEGRKQEPKKDDNGNFVVNKFGKRQMMFVLNPKFFFSVFSEVGSIKDPVLKRTLIQNGQRFVLSDFGTIYLICLFLPKKYIVRFLDEIHFFEASGFSVEQNSIIRDMLGIYRFRPVKGRFNSQSSNIALGLDILNELRRCPRELYEVLSKEGREQFAIPQDELNEFDGTESLNPDSFLMIRSKENRFPNLALNYIDRMGMFYNMRFQISLGNYRYKFYDKQCVDGETQLRVLQKEIHGYGRINEIEELRQEKWGRELGIIRQVNDEGHYDFDTLESQPYITDQKAAYSFVGNRIGILWDEMSIGESFLDVKNDYCYLPKIPMELDPTAKLEIPQPSPMCWLSIHDLPAMVFHRWLTHHYAGEVGFLKQQSSTERIIRNTYLNYRKFFSAVQDGTITPCTNIESLQKTLSEEYNLDVRCIPEKIKNYLSGNEETDATERRISTFVRIIKERKEKAQRTLDRFLEDRQMVGSKQNVFGKKQFTELRPGSLAAKLIQSITEWQPITKQGKNRLTGLNYSVLQANLALFGQGRDLEDIRFSLKNAHLLNNYDEGRFSQSAHPFLDAVLKQNPRNIEEFYNYYLQNEIKQLTMYLKYADQGRLQVNRIAFLHTERVRYQSQDAKAIRELAGRYLSRELSNINLPSGIFSQPIRLLIEKLCNEGRFSENQKQRLIECINPSNNVSYIIGKFFEIVLNDYSQPFYDTFDPECDYRRHYEFFDRLNDFRQNRRIALEDIYLTDEDICFYLTKRSGDEKIIHSQIDDYVNRTYVPSRDPRDRRDPREIAEEQKSKTRRKMIHLMNDCKNNERIIRERRVQDMVLMLIAQDILQPQKISSISSSQQISQNLKLHDIMSPDFLKKTIDFEVTITPKPNKKNTSPITGYKITQKSMQFKKYGEFYQVISDPRTPALIAQLALPEVQRAELETELAQYDQRRSDVFRLVHALEKFIIESNEDILMNPECEDFYADGKPIRDNFKSMLELLKKQSKIKTEDKDTQILTGVRNTFAHNNYYTPLKDVISEDELQLPLIAENIYNKIKNIYSTLEKEEKDE